MKLNAVGKMVSDKEEEKEGEEDLLDIHHASKADECPLVWSPTSAFSSTSHFLLIGTKGLD